MRILITGGFGFIGARLAVHLAKAGHQIFIGTRKPRSPPDRFFVAQVIKMEWKDLSSLQKTCVQIDLVIHAAGMNAQDCAADPESALDFNGEATARLVLAANLAGVKRFIYLSTIHVYSDPLSGLINEEAPLKNLHSYAISHIAGEQAVLNPILAGEMQGIVLRMSNVYGAPVDSDINCWTLLVNDLCKQAVKYHKLVLNTNGLQRRDFIDMREITQVVEYFLYCHDPLMERGIFNIGSGLSQSVLDMTKLIQYRCERVLGYAPLIERNEEKGKSSFIPFKYDISKLKATGYLTKENNVSEIDLILMLCKSKFIDN